jgi:hypothetical protein
MDAKSSLIKIAVFNEAAQAEVLRGLLEAQGVQVLLSKEAAGQVYGVFVGQMSEIELFVPAAQEQAARALVKEFFHGAEPDEK